MNIIDGDIVRVRSWDDLERQFGAFHGEGSSFIKTPRYLFIDEMRKFCGTIERVKRVNRDESFELWGIPFTFTEDMIENEMVILDECEAPEDISDLPSIDYLING